MFHGVRSHIGWREERSIFYKGVENSPQQTRFKIVRLMAICNKPKQTMSTSGGLGLLHLISDSSFPLSISGDTLGSFVYVPCEVMKQRMQVQGTRSSWSSLPMKDNISVKHGGQMYGYYSGMFQAGRSILKQQGLRGLYAGSEL